tara:strand:- start:44809 stop:45567 length:759 start_codon:yes stop_codon:yes gene_type:complete
MKGKKVLITRSTEDNKDFREQLERKGAEVIQLPMIQFNLSEDLTLIHQQLERLETIDWIVFTSTKTVEYFFQIAESKGIKLYYYPDLKIATVGEKTKIKLEQLGYRTNFVPIQYSAEVLAENMDENVEGKRILIPQSNLASKEYFKVFEKRGAIPIPARIYKTIPVKHETEIFKAVMNQKIDYLIFTSGSTFEAFYQNMQEAEVELTAEKIICIGPSTSKVVEERGMNVSCIAAPHTTEGMIKAIENLEEHV